ncbi:MAG: LAGLIDADG family homing endonuclease, partial [Candidatus Nanohaloarchaea archaeon]|nr:LAGLIDADG family homing endonuclease [Candidatus Nanohaloarchaea archaeon]
MTVTPDHSLFTYKDGDIDELEAGRIDEGDEVVIPAELPAGFHDTNHLNLLEVLPDCRVYAPELVEKAVQELSYREAGDICGVKTITDYYGDHEDEDPSSLKLDAFKDLMEESGIDYDPGDVQVTYDRRSKKLSADLPVTDELLRLLGYYIAEGGLNNSGKNNTINLYASEEDILEDMKHCIREVAGTEPRVRKSDRGFGESTELSFAHKPLFELLRKECGYGSENKKVPAFVFGLSKDRIGEFLTALWNGDGSFHQNYFAYYTVSEGLAQDVLQLLLSLGIVGRVQRRERDGRDTTDHEIKFYRKAEKERFLEHVKPMKGEPELPEKGHDDPNRVNGIYLDEVVDVKSIETEEPQPVYDISVPGTESFIGGFGGVMLHNSGHPSLSTMHASTPSDVVSRLTTPPINLSPALVET